MAFLLGALLWLTPAAPPTALPQVERAVFTLTNSERARRGLPALQADDTLDAIARGHSADMLRRNFFAHTNPDGAGPADRMARAHRQMIGEGAENVWSGSGYSATAAAAQIVADWMASAGHRANILNQEYTHLGVGVAMDGAEIRATQNFAIAVAYLLTPTPKTIRRGAMLDLAAKPVASATSPTQFDLWSEETGKRVFGPAPLVGVPVLASPGTYRLRFYFPNGNGKFSVRMGPAIEVR
jgi:hypothetical protein